MPYVAPKIQKKLETLSPALQKEVLSRHVDLRELNDLIQCLQDIADGK